MRPALWYLVPVHNDAQIIGRTVETLVAELARRPPDSGVHRVLLLENGSSDGSYRVAKELEGVREGVHVHAYHEPNAGLGFGVERGLAEAEKLQGDPKATWIVLTGSDLPFDFSDLDAFDRFYATCPRVRIAIGSKAHRDSVVATTPLRSVMTFVYRMARRTIIGMHTRDSQGSFFLRADLARILRPLLRTRDFFITTELVFFAERMGERPQELPVRLSPARRGSTVRPWKHGTQMLKSLVELRLR